MAALQSFTTLIACLPCSCQAGYSIRGPLFGEGPPFSCQIIPGEHRQRGVFKSIRNLSISTMLGRYLPSQQGKNGASL